MNKEQITQMAKNLMRKNNVEHLSFGYNRRKNALGICRFRLGKPYAIELSEAWIKHLREEDIRDTILHEIAHALAGSDAGHGPRWKNIAAAIGANPKRTAEDVPYEIAQRVRRSVSNYRATCQGCDNVIYFSRMTKNWRDDRYICSKCKSRFVVSYN